MSERAKVRRRELKNRPSGTPATPQWLHDTWDFITDDTSVVTGANMWDEEKLREAGMPAEDITEAQQPQEVQLAIMTETSPLRNKVYRADMLRKLGEQIDRLPDGGYKDMFRSLMQSHPRVMAAMQHSGTKIKMDPRYTDMELGFWDTHKPTALGTYTTPAGNAPQVPGLTVGRRQGGEIHLTPEDALNDWDSILRKKKIDTPYGSQMNTAAHETTHFGQYLRGDIDELEGLDNYYNMMLENFRKERGKSMRTDDPEHAMLQPVIKRINQLRGRSEPEARRAARSQVSRARRGTRRSHTLPRRRGQSEASEQISALKALWGKD